MVRLLPVTVSLDPELAKVSIPQWCDCCLENRANQRGVSDEFQSHNGAIAAVKYLVHFITLNSFNPTMVRLLPSPAQTRLPNTTSFNPTMVRLLLTDIGCCGDACASFNPTMVRLLRAGYRGLSWSCQFQSHNGAIAAQRCPAVT